MGQAHPDTIHWRDASLTVGMNIARAIVEALLRWARGMFNCTGDSRAEGNLQDDGIAHRTSKIGDIAILLPGTRMLEHCYAWQYSLLPTRLHWVTGRTSSLRLQHEQESWVFAVVHREALL